jgi:acetyl esterase/lipase
MNYPSIIFYFGGGLTNRNLNQLEVIAKKISSKGDVSFVVDYRVKSTESSTAIECITDAQDSFAFVRKNASAFAIDENKITAFGYSSGGYLSAALGTLTDKKNNSLSKPNSIILLAMGEPSQYKSPK